MSESLSKVSQLPIEKQEYRCPECSLVPFIEITSDQNKLIMETKCVNNHYFTDSFDQMQLRCKNRSKYYCQICKSENKKNIIEKDQILYYCSKCFNFYCYNHGKNIHVMKDGHQIFFNYSYDNICFEHNGNTVIGYCENHNKNYCTRCNDFAENNKRIEEELNEDQIKKYENEMNKNKKTIEEIETLFEKYKNTFKELENNFILYKQNMYKKNDFVKELINIYRKKQSESSLNYQFKANIEINHFDLFQKMKNINTKINA